MIWLRRWLLRWLNDESKVPAPIRMTTQGSGMHEGTPSYSVMVHEAMNGRILQLGRYKPNPHGPDWTYTSYIVPDGEDLPAAITALLVRQRLTP